MIIEEIKKSNLQAMRDKDSNLRAIYGIVINKHLQATINARTSGKEVDDIEMVKILQKTIKELEDERENYNKANNQQQAKKIEQQRVVLEQFLPQMMSEEEVKKVILSLSDRSIPTVMRHFKEHYSGKCDMRTVQTILKSL